MNILLCMPKFIDTGHPGCNGGGAWGWMLERQFKKAGWNVIFLNSFEPDPVPADLVYKQDFIIFRHSYQVEFRRYKDIVSKARRGAVIIQNFIDKSATEDWESFRVCRETDIWIAQNEDHMDLAKRVGFKSYILHYPIDMSEFSSTPRSNSKLLYVGRFCPQKGFESLIRAFGLIKKEHPDATLTLKGAWSWGEWGSKTSSGYMGYIDEMTRIIDGIGGIDILNGWTAPDTLSRIYNDHSILIFPVNGEPYGAPIVEAQSASMPVITSDSFAQKEKVIDGVDGFVLERKWVDSITGKYLLPSPSDIADRVNFLLDDNSRINMFGENSRRMAEKMYDQNVVMENLLVFLMEEFRNKNAKS